MIKDKWGHDKVAQICTFGSLQSKSVIDSIGKVLGIPYSVTTEIKKYIPDGTSLKDALVGNIKLQEYQEIYPKLFNYALRLEGIVRGISVHAGGIVVAPESKDINDFCAIALSKDKEEITQLEMHNVEEVGLVKMDLLGLSYLDIISDTLKMLGIDKDEFDRNLDLNDKKTYELLQSGNTDAVFQLESSGMKDVCVKLKPESIYDLSATVALYRPDSMKFLDHYIARKNSQEEIEYIHPDLEKILDKTFGLAIYQENLMNISKVFAGFSDGEADELRKGLGKKDKSIVKEQAEKFKNRALEKGYDKNIVDQLEKILLDAGGYGFNQAHAVAYGLTSYVTAYLKAHYPVEYMCSVLTNQRKDNGQADFEKVGQYISGLADMGIEIKNPCVNISNREFTPNGNSIIYGLDLIKGLNKSTIDYILECRPFSNFEDFINRSTNYSGIDKTSIISLIKSGAFDFTNRTRQELLLQYSQIRFESGIEDIKPIKNINKKHIEELLKEKKILPYQAEDKELCLKIFNKSRLEKFKQKWQETVMEGDETTWEFQTISQSLGGNPFKGYQLPSWESYEEGFPSAEIFGVVTSISKTKIKRGSQKGMTMAFVKFSTPEGIREGIAFASEWYRLQNRIERGKQLVVRGTKQGEQIIINGCMEFSLWAEKYGSNFMVR